MWAKSASSSATTSNSLNWPACRPEKGMKILLVPFWTDTKTGYLRVRRCAQARAIENECYVAISGSVGNIPKVETMGNSIFPSGNLHAIGFFLPP